MRRGHHRGEVDLFVRPGRHAPFRAMAVGWLAPVAAALLVVGGVVAWGIVSAREQGAVRRRCPSTAARLVARMSVWSAVCVLKVRPVGQQSSGSVLHLVVPSALR